MERRKKTIRYFLTPLVLGALVMAFVVGVPSLMTRAADHLDAPLVALDGRTDINDIYVFQSPTNTANTVLIMTVNPGAGVLSPTTFDPGARYEFMIDQDGNAIRDGRIVVSFGQPDGEGNQQYRIRSSGIGGLRGSGMTGDTVSLRSRSGDAGIVTVDLFDDPFFFDLNEFAAGFANRLGAQDCVANPGNDFFAGLNVSAIVLEVPSSLLDSGDSDIGVWARTLKGLGQVDRMGRPAINTVFIPSNPFEPTEPSLKNSFNSLRPFFDQRVFDDEIVDTLGLFYDLQDASDVATVASLVDTLLPDILTVDTSNSAGFLNGRGLTNDVIDAELGLVTKNAVTTDCVGSNDATFPGAFPYLASPHGSTNGS